MKTIQVKVGQLKPNPFKKYINNGKLDPARTEKLEESISHGTLPFNFQGREHNGELQISSGHHTQKATENKKGKDFIVNFTINDFSDEQMLVDMIRENLTHRGTDFRDMEDSIVLSRAWIQSKERSVKPFDTRFTRKEKGLFTGSKIKIDSVRSISKFLSKQGKTLSHETIRSYLLIHDQLDQGIHKAVGKIESATKEEAKNKIGVRVASTLALFEKKQQKPLFEQIKKSKLNRDEIIKRLSSFKKADPQVKKKILSGKESLENVKELQSVENFSEQKRGKAIMSNKEAIVEFKYRLNNETTSLKKINAMLFAAIKKKFYRRIGTKELSEVGELILSLEKEQVILARFIKKSKKQISEGKKNVLR